MKKTTKKAETTKPASTTETFDAAFAKAAAQPKTPKARREKPAAAPAKGKATKKAAPAKKAPKAKKAAEKEGASAPRESSKTAIITGLITRKGGATLAELMTATGWQKHSVRGFISTFGKKHTIESTKNDAGERCYALKA